MQLTLWTYEGPPHVGAMRVATAMEGVHYVLHAPQGDTYADLLFTMIERRGKRPPVTYTTFQARDLGKDTAELFQQAALDAVERFRPQALLVGASCTAELIQDDPAGLAEAMGFDVPVIPLELPSYQRKEHWGASETFYRLVRTLCDGASRTASEGTPSANLLGPCALGFRHRDDVAEIIALLGRLGVNANVVAPLGASPADIRRLPQADFNILLYPEIGEEAARWLERSYGQPTIRTIPFGHRATCDFVREVAALAGVDPEPVLRESGSRLPWWSRSVDSTYLTGKRVFVFGEGSRAVAAARVATEELGFELCGLGCYNREFARGVRDAARAHDVEPLITDDYLEVERAIAAAQPELVLGTQMERHIAKRLGIPCAVISSPAHVQDFPARHSPQMGFEGANVLFDTWVHPLVMGLEEHLLAMFRDDFEFRDEAGASHILPTQGVGRGSGQVGSPREPSTCRGHVEPAHSREASGGGAEPAIARSALLLHQPAAGPPPHAAHGEELWDAAASRELLKVPFFVRGKAKRNTEAFAAERGLATITLDTLYEAKAHHAR